MIEKYIGFKMFFEYTLPFIILGLLLCVFIYLIVSYKISDAVKKRKKKKADKHCKNKEGE